MKAQYYQMDVSPHPTTGHGSMPGSRTQSASDARRGAGGSRGSGGSAGNGGGGGLGADYKPSDRGGGGGGGGGGSYENYTPAHAEYRNNSDAKQDYMSFENDD